MSDNDGVTCYEGMDGYVLVDKAQYDWLIAENARLKRELSNANREFDRVTGWGYSVLTPQTPAPPAANQPSAPETVSESA